MEIHKKCSVRLPRKVVPKEWGNEIWIENNESYCGKILNFKKGAKFSLHFHVLKSETFYVINGKFRLYYLDTDTAEKKEKIIYDGDVVDIPVGCPHQLECLDTGSKDYGIIAEFSTQHFDEDSYRVLPGDSQKRIENQEDRV